MDVQGQAPVTPPDTPIKDPEAQHEADEIKVKRLKLEYYKELAGVIAVYLQTFKTEAVSLVSGVGTLVMGYYQLKKWVVQNKADIKVIKDTNAVKEVPLTKTVHPEYVTMGKKLGAKKVSAKKAALHTKSLPMPPTPIPTVGVPAPAPAQTFVSKIGVDTMIFAVLASVFLSTALFSFSKQLRARFLSKEE